MMYIHSPNNKNNMCKPSCAWILLASGGPHAAPLRYTEGSDDRVPIIGSRGGGGCIRGGGLQLDRDVTESELGMSDSTQAND
jgi:hypothetical protein